ncbi:Dihydrolipoyl dehydrogenase [Candidatus Bilamarchaeum dharawalense]|uniref:Dihydrolipoyl dehydrogenase n=1 Tax=Candidatus Bilamarchaeum dharawalense TaxID=2885759 RepID=A0A5E4LQH8_9ARCH|nr:Dihydrolipoyl dehydrogenase [Candidatus Bilamarchaeum dharawalense]
MKFDLIVIGGGSGLDIMSAAAAKGMSVAIVEEGPLGGTCLNRGCIPSKILIHTADVLQTIRNADKFGIKVGKVSVDFQKIMERSFIVDKDAEEIEQSIRKHPKIKLFKVRGKFTGPKTLQVGSETITADKIVIAAGTRPALPPIEGLDKVPHMTSDQVLRVKKLPKELIVVGGGYIACELAHFFGTLGSKITILMRNVRLLPDEDEEIGLKFTELFSKQYDVKLRFPVAKVEKKGTRIVVYGKDGTRVEGTDILFATGRVPNTDILDVSKTNVKTNPEGYVETNEFMETNVPGIWAIGDIAGKYLFKHSANLEAEYVTISILNPEHKHKVDYTAMPHAVFSNPQVAGVGATEQELKAKNIDYLVGKYEYSKTGMGEALAEKDGFVKFMTDYEGKILGCHIIGPEASTLIHEVLVSMKAGKCHVNDIINTIHIHPSLSEVVQRGAGSV